MVVSRLRAASRISGADRFQFVHSPVQGTGRGRNGSKLPDGLPHGSVHALDVLDILDVLVHPVFNEDLLESSGPEFCAQFLFFNLELGFQYLQQSVRAGDAPSP